MRKIAYMGRRSNPDPYITSQLHWASHRPNSTPLLSLLKARITLRIADRIGITDRDSDLDSLFTLRIQFAIYAFTHLLCMTMFNLQNYNFNRYIKKKKLCACLLFLIMAEDESCERKKWVPKWVSRRKEKDLHRNLFLHWKTLINSEDWL